jgi:ATP-dependent protease ClpP protease subunit
MSRFMKLQTKKRVRLSDDNEDDNEDESKHVKQWGNKVFFYADVTTESVHALYEAVNEANKNATVSTPSEVHLHLNSQGGDAYAGFAAYHILKKNPLPIITYVDGLVCSAATFLLMTGKKRVASKHAFVLIHQVSTGFFGKYNDMIDEMQNTHDLMEACRNLYTDHTTMSPQRLEELLKSERAVNAKTCLDDGIVHLIED